METKRENEIVSEAGGHVSLDHDVSPHRTFRPEKPLLPAKQVILVSAVLMRRRLDFVPGPSPGIFSDRDVSGCRVTRYTA